MEHSSQNNLLRGFYLFSVEYNLLKRRRNKKNSWFFKEVNGLSINFEKGGTNEWKMVANGPPIITWKLMDLWHRRPISWKSLKNELDQTLPFLEEQASVRSFVSPLLTYLLPRLENFALLDCLYVRHKWHYISSNMYNIERCLWITSPFQKLIAILAKNSTSAWLLLL